MLIGRSIRWYKDYEEEVAFCRKNKFDFLQIWFRKGEILIDTLEEPKERYIKENGFPVIIHAVFDIDDFKKYGDQLLSIVSYLNHNELIIHPVCEEKEITEDTIKELSKHINDISKSCGQKDIKLYIENNSAIDTINYKPKDLKLVFSENPDVELLLDIAHIDNYEHLEEIVGVKYPQYLHIADKRFGIQHEHLPLGQGDLDYKYIFSKYLNEFKGNIILEVVDEDSEVINSKGKLLEILK